MSKSPSFSFIAETPPAPADAAHQHFIAKLAVETDPSDVHTDLSRERPGFAVIDTRSAVDLGLSVAGRRVPELARDARAYAGARPESAPCAPLEQVVIKPPLSASAFRTFRVQRVLAC